MSINLLTVAGTGNAAFLNELLKAGLDPDVGDSTGKTPLVDSSNCFSYKLINSCDSNYACKPIYLST